MTQKPCRFLFIHVESIVDRQSASGEEALTKPLPYPQVRESIHHCLHQQQVNQAHQWRVIFYTTFPESRRDQVIQWLNEQLIWGGSDTLLVMRDPFRSSHVVWTTAIVHELSAMFGANDRFHDQCLVFDKADAGRGDKPLQSMFNQSASVYAEVYVCSTLGDFVKYMRDWK